MQEITVIFISPFVFLLTQKSTSPRDGDPETSVSEFWGCAEEGGKRQRVHIWEINRIYEAVKSSLKHGSSHRL